MNAHVDSLQALEQREIDYWRDSEHEAPESDSISNIVNKIVDVPILWDLLHRYATHFHRSAAPQVVELGGGQGWAACLAKRVFPNATVTLTDLSPFAVQSAHKWERVFGAQLDGTRVCSSYETGFDDDSFDVAFCFASAHHFKAHRRTLLELRRILRPGGTAIYLFEPTSSRLLYPLAYRRINRLRPAIREDVLIWREILQLARQAGLTATVDFYTTPWRRSAKAAAYYSALSGLRFLCGVLPCTANFVFRKAA